jgi:hypothetical protein
MRRRQHINGYHSLALPAAHDMVERWTRDAIVPIAEDVPLDEGWRCIPVPPSIWSEWIPVDTTKDRKTGWAKRRGDRHDT